MSYKRRSDYKPPRQRTEVRVAVLTSLVIILATASLVWFLRPNRESTPTAPAPNKPTVVTTAPGSTTPPGSTTAPGSTIPPQVTVSPAPTPASSTP
jgi:hypothetical protein